MSTSKNACACGLIIAALLFIAIVAVLAINSRQASTSAMPSTPAPSASATTARYSAVSHETVSPQTNPAPAMHRLAKLAEAGIDVDTLAVLQECQKGWQDHAPKTQNALVNQTFPNAK
jgi:hypothetical protein